MAATIRNTVLATLAAAMVVGCASQAEAQFRFRFRPRVRLAPQVVVTTTPAISHPIPYLGFDSYFDGSGEHVTAVQYGSAAWRIGLEPGDRVVAVDGVPLQYHDHGLQLLQGASYRGHVTLAIRDLRTGLVVNRTLALGSSTVTYRSSSVGYVVRPGLRPRLRPSGILRRFPR